MNQCRTYDVRISISCIYMMFGDILSFHVLLYHLYKMSYLWRYVSFLRVSVILSFYECQCQFSSVILIMSCVILRHFTAFCVISKYNVSFLYVPWRSAHFNVNFQNFSFIFMNMSFIQYQFFYFILCHFHKCHLYHTHTQVGASLI